MFDELVFVTQAVLVHHTGVVEHDGIVQRAAQRQIVGAQRFEIAHETEGACAADLLQKGGGRKIHGGALQAALEYRVVEFDLEIDLEALEGVELRPLVAVRHAHRLLDAHETFGRGLLFHAG